MGNSKNRILFLIIILIKINFEILFMYIPAFVFQSLSDRFETRLYIGKICSNDGRLSCFELIIYSALWHFRLGV